MESCHQREHFTCLDIAKKRLQNNPKPDIVHCYTSSTELFRYVLLEMLTHPLKKHKNNTLKTTKNITS